jgi:hypothetical protein
LIKHCVSPYCGWSPLRAYSLGGRNVALPPIRVNVDRLMID